MRLPDARRSSAVLVGVSSYAVRGLPNLPSVCNNLTGLLAALTDPSLGVLQRDRCSVLSDPIEVRATYRALKRAAVSTEDTLLLYFTGHGCVGPRNELYLALADTDPDELTVSALPYQHVREIFAASPATNRVIILDCCFSGRATEDMSGADRVLGQLDVAGTYVLAATPANAVALAPSGERYTVFTGALLDLLSKGVAEGPSLLTCGEIYRQLQHSMRLDSLPVPTQRSTGTADLLALSRNAAQRQRADVRRSTLVSATPTGLGTTRATQAFLAASHGAPALLDSSTDAAPGSVDELNPWTSSGSPFQPIAEVSGILGRVAFDGRYIMISKANFVSSLSRPMFVHVNHVSAIVVKSATHLVHGYIQVQLKDLPPEPPRKWWSLTSAGRPRQADPYSVSIRFTANAAAGLVKAHVESVIRSNSGVPEPTLGTRSASMPQPEPAPVAAMVPGQASPGSAPPRAPSPNPVLSNPGTSQEKRGAQAPFRWVLRILLGLATLTSALAEAAAISITASGGWPSDTGANAVFANLCYAVPLIGLLVLVFLDLRSLRRSRAEATVHLQDGRHGHHGG